MTRKFYDGDATEYKSGGSPTPQPTMEEMQRALESLYLCIDKDVAVDINNKVWAALKEKNNRISKLEKEREDIINKIGALNYELKLCLNGKRSEYLKALTEECDEYLNNL